MKKEANLKDLIKFINEYVGNSGGAVFEVLAQSDKGILDVDIMKKTGLDEQEVRRVLYELQALGIASYRRDRSPEDGRFLYYWFIDSGRLNQILIQRKKAVVNKLKERLEYESKNTFFTCPRDGTRLTFDEALENDFKCPKCEGELVAEDNSGVKEFLRSMIAKLEEEIANEERKIATPS